MLPADMEGGSAGRPARSSYSPLASPSRQQGRLRSTILVAGATALVGVVAVVALGHRARPGVEAKLGRGEQLIERTANIGTYPPYLDDGAGNAAGTAGIATHSGSAGGPGLRVTGTIGPVGSTPTGGADEIAADGSFQQGAAAYVSSSTAAPAAAIPHNTWPPLPTPRAAPGQWQQPHPLAGALGHAVQNPGTSLQPAGTSLQPAGAAHIPAPMDGPASGVSIGGYSGRIGEAAGNRASGSSPRHSAQNAAGTAGGTGGNVGGNSLGSVGGMGQGAGTRGGIGGAVAGNVASTDGAASQSGTFGSVGRTDSMGRAGSMGNAGSTSGDVGPASVSGPTAAMGTAGNMGGASGSFGTMGSAGNIGGTGGSFGTMGSAGNTGGASGTLGTMGSVGNTAPGGAAGTMGNAGARGGSAAAGGVGAVGMGAMGTTSKVAAPTQTTTTLTTTTVLPNTTTTRPSVSLYCWALMMPHGAEVALVRTLLNKGAGLFGCDDYEVFSSGDIELSPGPPVRIGTTDIGSVKCKYGGPWYLALNSQVFIKVWKKIFQGEAYKRNDWTVKIDPDAVFLPKRLRKEVQDSNPDAVVYLNNCDQGLHGPIEVIATGGMKVFAQGVEDCEQHLSYEFEKWGEDVFLRHCLGMLKVNRVDNFHLLSEDRCFYENPAKNGCTSGKAAFHPFKKPDKYFQCLKQAEDADKAAEHEK